ncbi:MAG TPA: hypothetical protein VN783_09450 [Thermoanaerobaculia bacterium]|nr:hypothetical protein [Thermoanaerobaculia bacterium]
MKRKLQLHRDTLRNLDSVDGVDGGGIGGPTQQVSVCIRCSGGGTCAFPCTLQLSVCVQASCHC